LWIGVRRARAGEHESLPTQLAILDMRARRISGALPAFPAEWVSKHPVRGTIVGGKGTGSDYNLSGTALPTDFSMD